MNALCGKLWCILFVFDYIIKDGCYILTVPSGPKRELCSAN